MARIAWVGGAVGDLAAWDGASCAVAWIGPAETGPALLARASAADRADAAGLPIVARAAFLQRRLVLRACVARWMALPADAVVVAYDAVRRPILRDPGGLTVSAASRAGVLAVALAKGPVGIDVEVPTGGGTIASAVLTPAENRRLGVLPEEGRETAFLALWTVKEAYLKAIGLGLARDPATIDVAVDAEILTVADGGRPVPLRCGEARALRLGGRAVQAACIVL